MKVVWIASFAVAATSAFAQTTIYKHTDESGRVTYSNKPIKGAVVMELEPITLVPGLAAAAAPATATKAVATLEREKVDLILSDVRLTGERNGIDLARIAKEKAIPVLFATGMVPDEAVDLAIGCLMKPYSQRMLKAALAAVDQHLRGEQVRAPKGLTLYGV